MTSMPSAPKKTYDTLLFQAGLNGDIFKIESCLKKLNPEEKELIYNNIVPILTDPSTTHSAQILDFFLVTDIPHKNLVYLIEAYCKNIKTYQDMIEETNQTNPKLTPILKRNITKTIGMIKKILDSLSHESYKTINKSCLQFIKEHNINHRLSQPRQPIKVIQLPNE